MTGHRLSSRRRAQGNHHLANPFIRHALIGSDELVHQTSWRPTTSHRPPVWMAGLEYPSISGHDRLGTGTRARSSATTMSRANNSAAGQRQLPLAPFPWIEQQALAVPAQQVSVVVAMTGGHLTGGTEHDQLPDRHRSRVRPVIALSGQ
jgi:hypothetical protein